MPGPHKNLAKVLEAPYLSGGPVPAMTHKNTCSCLPLMLTLSWHLKWTETWCEESFVAINILDEKNVNVIALMLFLRQIRNVIDRQISRSSVSHRIPLFPLFSYSLMHFFLPHLNLSTFILLQRSAIILSRVFMLAHKQLTESFKGI